VLPHVITVVAADGETLAPEALARNLSGAFATHSVEAHGWRWIENGRAGEWFFTPENNTNLVALAAGMREALGELRVDVAIQPDALRIKRLIISDMDSTLIQQECIDELAAEAGIGAHVASITERAMRGELDFIDALTERVSLLKDLKESVLEKVWHERIQLMPGAKTCMTTLRSLGARTIVVSGGFRFFTQRVADALYMHEHHANQLEVVLGALTGRVIPPIMDKFSKQHLLEQSCRLHGHTLTETMALGDGANDIPMLQTAGLGIACHAKPIVLEATSSAIRYGDLTTALWFMGIPCSQWKTA
jgi:phosphoserine phosphatase